MVKYDASRGPKLQARQFTETFNSNFRRLSPNSLQPRLINNWIFVDVRFWLMLAVAMTLEDPKLEATPRIGLPTVIS